VEDRLARRVDAIATLTSSLQSSSKAIGLARSHQHVRQRANSISATGNNLSATPQPISNRLAKYRQVTTTTEAGKPDRLARGIGLAARQNAMVLAVCIRCNERERQPTRTPNPVSKPQPPQQSFHLALTPLWMKVQYFHGNLTSPLLHPESGASTVPAKTKGSTSVKKVGRSLLSWFKRGLRLLKRLLQTDQPLPAFIGAVMGN
jgi:hypothetical protein